METLIHSPYSNVRTLAVAPAINLSGTRDFDPLVVSDILYAEMQQVEGLNVLPLNKTLLAMQRLGIRSIDDPKAAQKLAEYLGADGLVIPAITAYDPYNPPMVGMILQMYTPAGVAAAEAAPVKPPVVETNPDRPTIAADIAGPSANAQPDPSRQPVSQVSAVFNSTNQTVLKELAVFARGRTQYDSAMMDQKFLADADQYMRFVCHAMVRRLMDVERDRLSDR